MASLVQIQLVDTNQGYLDLAEGTDFPLNFGISDVRDLTQRKGTTSKTIKLAGSKNNNVLLNNYFDVNVIAGTFDINTLQKCAVIQDGIVILDDVYLQLTKVVKSQTTGNHDNLVSYECVIKDSTSDFFTVIGNNELTDLQLQSQETYHLYTAANVVDSWNHTWEDVYKYVMPINTTSNKYTLNQWVPGIYAKQYWNKIFEAAGYTYEWDEHTGTTQQFDKLIIPFNGDQSELTAEVLEDLQVIAENTGSTEYTYAQATNGTAILFQHNANFPIEVEDEQGYYNPGTSTYTNAFYLQGSNTLQYEYEIDYQLILRNQAGSTATSVVGTNYNAYVRIQKSGVATQYNNLSIVGTSPNFNPGATIPAGDTVISSGVVTRTLQLSNLNVGDYHKYKFLIVPNGGGVSAWDKRVDIVLKINSIRMKIVPKIEMLGYTFPVFLNTFVPKKIKQSDFIKAFVIRYNLYIEIDKFNSKNLIIKSRDKYYDDGKEEDWTKLLNKQIDQEIQFLPDLSKKKFKLTDKQDDKDEALSVYFENTSQIYGESVFTFDNEYTKDIETKETIFSPTIITDKNTFGAVTPSIAGPNPKTNIRLLYDGGMFSCSSWYIYNFGTSGTGALTQYPLFSHQNSPTAPTFDINFGQCGYYAIENLGLTNNNMYNLHWRRTLNQMNTSKMLTAYFDLKASDIQKMALSDRIRIDNSYWNINKIVDFNPTKEGPTKVELLSIDADTKFSPFNTWVKPIKPIKPIGPIRPVKPIIGGWLSIDNGIKKTDKKGQDFSNVINGNIGSIDGQNNFVGDSSESGAIYGRNNVADFGGFILGHNNISNSNAFIYGSDNFIPEGMGNSMVIGNGIILDSGSTPNTMYASNVSIVNNLTIASGATLNMSGVTITGLDYLPLSGGVMDSGAQISGATGNYLDLDFNFGPITNGVILLNSGIGPVESYFVTDKNYGTIIKDGASDSQIQITPTSFEIQATNGNLNLTSTVGDTNIIAYESLNLTSTVGDTNIFAYESLNLTSSSTSVRTSTYFLVRDGSSSAVGIYTRFDGLAFSSTFTNAGSTIISSNSSLINAGLNNTVILGGTGIIASESNSVYVPKLNIGITSGTSISSLGIDSNGFVVTGSTVVNKYAATVTLNAGNNTITHNLNDTDVIVAIKTSAGVVQIPNSVDSFAANTVNINVSSTLTNARVIIIK